MDSQNAPIDTVVINEVQLVLAEKRTSLAVMRTGIAVLVLPLSVLSVLIATSRYYLLVKDIPLRIPVLLICLGLIFLGTYLVLRAIHRMRHYDVHLNELKKQYQRIAELLE